MTNRTPEFLFIRLNSPPSKKSIPFFPMPTAIFIEYSIPEITISSGSSQKVTLKVYDILGREVAALINKNHSSGKYKINFDAEALTSGLYIYQLKVGNYIQAKKMLLLK